MTTEGYNIVDNVRLDKIERQLDIIVTKLESLVRLEERHDGAVRRLDRMEARLDTHGKALDHLAVHATVSENSIGKFERLA